MPARRLCADGRSRSASTTGAVTPWVMEKAVAVPPRRRPPRSTSETWTDDYNEIRELGGRNSTKRSAEQTDIGRFWFVTGPQAWNPIVRQIAAAKKLDLVDSARLFALVSTGDRRRVHRGVRRRSITTISGGRSPRSAMPI